MFKFIKNSLRNKLLIAFIGVGFLPYLLFLAYTLILSETKMVNKTIGEQREKTIDISSEITNHISDLNKEVQFLAQLDLMDDLLIDDIDKRVSRLLSQKSSDYNFKNILFALNAKKSIIASSDKNLLARSVDINTSLENNNSLFIKNNVLYIYAKVYASFNPSQHIATLFFSYPLTNFNAYLNHKKDIHSTIIDKKNISLFKDALPFSASIMTNSKEKITPEHLIIKEKMPKPFENYSIVYAVDKSLALAFLYDFIRFMLYISPFIFFIIIFVSLRYSKHIVKPIQKLTDVTQDIIDSKDYEKSLHVSGKDEIAKLSTAFNELLYTTHTALQALEKENKLRLKRFIQLIETFNTIIQTQNENECITTSIKQIQILTDNESIRFENSTEKQSNGISIEVNDFEKNEKVFIGSIILNSDLLADTNESRFYHSIATMISLQLDRIHLIERTMSASNAKSAFISNMSHELRTPLNAIIGFSQYLITYEELNEDQLDVVSNIESSAQYLLSMINEILDMAKIEAGKMEVSIEPSDIFELVESAHTMLMPLAQEKNLNFTFEYKDFEKKQYPTDAKMFKQIVVNLLSNAIKFTLEGEVSINLSSSKERVTVRVTDSGIGIKEDDLKALFNDFTQLENVMRKKHKGTGLGLSLSKKMAQLLHGDITLHSEGEGYGTESIFYIKVG